MATESKARPDWLDVGCGRQKPPGALGVDLSPDTAADVVHDLNRFPWPFADDSFARITLVDTLEHLDDVIKVLEECWRIARDGAELHVRVPHFSSVQAFTDPTHKHFFSTQSLDYFWPGELAAYGHYTRARLEKLSVKIRFWRLWRLTGVAWLANRFPRCYEKLFAFRFTAQHLEFRLRARKALPAATD